MKRRISFTLGAAWLGIAGHAYAHHGEADDLGGQLVHATFDPSHLAATVLAAGAILAGYRLVRALRRRPMGRGQ